MMLAFLERSLGSGGVVAYHGVRESDLLPSVHVTPKAFRAHMDFLAASYHVISLEEFVARRMNGKSVRRCVAVTFDDAYAGVLTHALPVLEHLGAPATVFVPTHFCGRDTRFWWDRLEWVMQRVDDAGRRQVLRCLGLGGQASDHEVRDRIIMQFRGALPHSLDRELRRVEGRVGSVPERPMTSDELVLLSQSDFVDFGCHSAHHYALPWLTDGKAESEIRLSSEWLRKRLPHVKPYVAYPYGLYSAATTNAARRAGMKAAFALEGRAATSRFALFSCPRIGMADVNTLRGLRLRLSWATIPVVAARNGSWHPRLRPPAVTGSAAISTRRAQAGAANRGFADDQV